MKKRTASRIATALDRVRLLGPASRARESWLARKAASGPQVDDDGLPLPPPRMRLLVSGGGADAHEFLWVGGQAAAAIRRAAEQAGTPLESMDAILDFGCGCGRIARHWSGLERPRVHGSDYNEELVDWCRRNLPFMEVAVNGIEPPTSYADESFDLIYALSVFSHLDEPLQGAWMSELRRMLRPGGLLLISVLGEADRDRLTSSQRERFDDGELIVERARVRGTNLCTAYHPRSYVLEQLLDGFVDAAHLELGADGRTLSQEGYVARRPARAEAGRR